MPFCHGDAGVIGRSRIPMALTRAVKTGPVRADFKSPIVDTAFSLGLKVKAIRTVPDFVRLNRRPVQEATYDCKTLFLIDEVLSNERAIEYVSNIFVFGRRIYGSAIDDLRRIDAAKRIDWPWTCLQIDIGHLFPVNDHIKQLSLPSKVS
jgi:hypothetical protein